MFNLFKRNKKYKEQEIQVSYYKSPKLSIDSIDSKYIKIEDYIYGERYNNLVKIKDNGICSAIELKNEYINKTLLAKYGYAVIVPGTANNGNNGIIFCNSIKDCIGEYSKNQYKKTNLINAPCSIRYPIYNGDDCKLGLRNISKAYGISVISDVEYPLILEFLVQRSIYTKTDCLPILFNDDDFLCKNDSIWGYEQSRGSHNASLPVILYGAFYLDTDPITNGNVVYHISENLLCMKDIKIKVADVKKSNKSILDINGYLFYKDDIKYYPSIETYLSENKSIRRNKKLDALLIN